MDGAADPSDLFDLSNVDPRDPDANTSVVLWLYGATMMSIQGFERSLAWLAIILTRDPVKETGPFDVQFRRSFDRFHRAFQRDPAGTLRKRIKGRVSDELYDRIGEFIKRRNHVAHRVLVERIEQGDDGARRFRRGTTADLLLIGIDATKLGGELHALAEAERAKWPAPEEALPPEAQQAMQDVAEFLFRRRVRPEVLMRLQRKA
jgi:hypothetical protein